jgi:hypothetical protein
MHRASYASLMHRRSGAGLQPQRDVPHARMRGDIRTLLASALNVSACGDARAGQGGMLHPRPLAPGPAPSAAASSPRQAFHGGVVSPFCSPRAAAVSSYAWLPHAPYSRGPVTATGAAALPSHPHPHPAAAAPAASPSPPPTPPRWGSRIAEPGVPSHRCVSLVGMPEDGTQTGGRGVRATQPPAAVLRRATTVPRRQSVHRDVQSRSGARSAVAEAGARQAGSLLSYLLRCKNPYDSFEKNLELLELLVPYR